MKKYLLGLLSIPFGLFAFSNAETINVSCPFQDLCTPYEINISSDNCVDGVSQLTLSNISCVQNENSEIEDLGTDCGLILESVDGSWYNITYDNGEIVDNTCYLESDNTLFTVDSANGEMDISVSLNLLSSNSGGGDGGDDNTGGNGGSNVGGGIITDLSSAIDGLHSTVIELIPYIVYLGIGILLFTLGFYLIRWLVNWMGGKIKSNFSSKRN